MTTILACTVRALMLQPFYVVCHVSHRILKNLHLHLHGIPVVWDSLCLFILFPSIYIDVNNFHTTPRTVVVLPGPPSLAISPC